MFRLFQSNNPGVVVFYWIYLLLFRVSFFFLGERYSFAVSTDDPLSHFVFSLLPRSGTALPVVSLLLSALLTFFQALLINGIVNGNKMTHKRGYLPGVIFIFYASLFPEAIICSPALLALTFAILFVASLFRLSRDEKAVGGIFDSGFLSALAALFYFPLVVLLLFAYPAISVIRRFSPKEWIILLLGFLAPVFLLFTWYVVTDTVPGNFLPAVDFSAIHLSDRVWLLLAGLSVSLLLWVFLLQGVLYSSLIQVRKFANLLIFLAFLLAGSLVLQKGFSLSHFVLLSLPVSIIGAMVCMQIKRNAVLEIIHLILILLVLAGQYLPLIGFN